MMAETAAEGTHPGTATDQGVHPLNLSISVSGGKEIKRDSPSSCERTGMSPRPNPPVPHGACGPVVEGPVPQWPRLTPLRIDPP